MDYWYVLAVNPDPWAIGPLGVGRRNGKYYPYVGANTQLKAYKEAVAEELANVAPLPEGEYSLAFWFWRKLDGRKHQSDATNLQKATEDALQGCLIENDRDVRAVSSVIVEQSPTVVPCVVIRARVWAEFDPDQLPDHIWEQVDRTETPNLFDNTWSGPGGL